MTALDLEAEYNNRARVPEHPEIFRRWNEDAAKFREAHKNTELNVRYGTSERQYLDFFWPSAARDTPLVLFIHGGYWRSLDPSSFSHMAAGANARGIAMALMGYDLCPQVTIAQIIGQARNAAAFVGKRYGRKIVVAGHSAGGHLTACLVAADWKKIDPVLPADFVPAGLSISGLFDLEPMLHTSMNQELRLNPDQVRDVSPQFWPVPSGRTLDAWVGGDESSEFLRQSREVVDVWGKSGVTMQYKEVSGTNHFTVLDPLTDPRSEMTGRLVQFSAQIA